MLAESDCSTVSLIAKGGVFAPLADRTVFRAAATVMNDTIAWDISGNRDEYNCIDMTRSP
jgi:hypothetical protein